MGRGEKKIEEERKGERKGELSIKERLGNSGRKGKGRKQNKRGIYSSDLTIALIIAILQYTLNVRCVTVTLLP